MANKNSYSTIENKTDAIRLLLAQTKWLETSFIWITTYFGFKLNNDAFAILARTIPLKTLLDTKIKFFN